LFHQVKVKDAKPHIQTHTTTFAELKESVIADEMYELRKWRLGCLVRRALTITRTCVRVCQMV